MEIKDFNISGCQSIQIFVYVYDAGGRVKMYKLKFPLLTLIFSGIVNYGVTGFTYLGCFGNENNNTLTDWYPTSSSTVDCFFTCLSASRSYSFAGTQTDPIACYCGNRIFQHEVDVHSDCGVNPCPMSSSDLCGGKLSLAVYNITGEHIPIVISSSQTKSSMIKTNPTSPSQLTSENAKTVTAAGYLEPFVPISSQEIDSNALKINVPPMKTYNSEVNKSWKSLYLSQNKNANVSIGSLMSSPSSMPMQCCQCSESNSKWKHITGENVTRGDLEVILREEIEELCNNLTINKKNTSNFKRRKKSASDNRTSSILIGLLGSFIVCLPFVLIGVSDINIVWKAYQRRLRKDVKPKLNV